MEHFNQLINNEFSSSLTSFKNDEQKLRDRMRVIMHNESCYNESEIKITKNELLLAIKDILKLPPNTKINYSMGLGTSLEKMVASSINDPNVTNKGSWCNSDQTRLSNSLTVNQNRLNNIKDALRKNYGNEIDLEKLTLVSIKAKQEGKSR